MRIVKRGIIVVLFILAFGLTVAQAQQAAVNFISVEELKARMAKNDPILIVDVRSPEGFANSTTTMKGSYHYKVRNLKYRSQFAPFRDLRRDSEIVTYCACPKDEASIAAAQILQTSGFTRVRVLQGGWIEWLKANGPVHSRARN